MPVSRHPRGGGDPSRVELHAWKAGRLADAPWISAFAGMTGCSGRSTCRSFLLAALVALVPLAPAAAQEGGMPGMTMTGESTTGGDLTELIAIARKTNPDLAVAALEADAAAAKIAGADSLPDPKLQWQAMDIPRSDSTYLPARLPRTDKVFLQQDFPLWGKRDLKREIAVANSRKADALRQVAENELVARVKAAYAQYHQIHLAMDLDRELQSRLGAIVKLARARYEHGLAPMQEVTSAEIEKTDLASDLVRLDAERRKARVRLNSLLGREQEAPFSETFVLRPMPANLDEADLVSRAHGANPDLKAADAEISSSEHQVSLAEKSWYPDIGVSLGGVKQNGRFDGYEAMLEVNIPIRGGLRDSDIGEAKAMALAAGNKRRARELELDTAVNEAFWNLKAAERTEKLMLESSLPEARLGFESAVHAYEQGKGEFIMVLTAAQQWRKTHLAHLQVQLDQQMELANLEKLAGGEL